MHSLSREASVPWFKVEYKAIGFLLVTLLVSSTTCTDYSKEFYAFAGDRVVMDCAQPSGCKSSFLDLDVDC